METCTLNSICYRGLDSGHYGTIPLSPFCDRGDFGLGDFGLDRYTRIPCWDLVARAVRSEEAFAALAAKCAAHDANYPYDWSEPVTYDWLLSEWQQRHPAAHCPEMPIVSEEEVRYAIAADCKSSDVHWATWHARVDAAGRLASEMLRAGRGGDFTAIHDAVVASRQIVAP